MEAPLVVIVGLTASGKSDLAMELAERYEGEIIAADARTVYRGMDIGTAKPSERDQIRVRHHLLDIRDPSEQYTVADFKLDALKVIKDITNRGKLPIMVGGTGLYIDSVLFDYSFKPRTDVKTRQKIQHMLPKALMATLDKAGISYDHVDIKNVRRLQRLVETAGAQATRKPLRPNTLVLGLQPDRATLRRRIEKRVESMVGAGFVEELQGLVASYGWENEALKGIGYKAFRDYLEGTISLKEAQRRFVRGDIGLAKRQRTWLKRNPSIQWISSNRAVHQKVEQFLRA